MTLEEFFEFLDEERRNRSWYQRVVDAVYRWTSLKPRRAIGNFFGAVVNRHQRARYGVGYLDMRSFPSYIAGVLAHAATLQADEGYTYPGEDRGFTETEWEDYLRDIAKALREYQAAFDDTDHFPGCYDDLLGKQERARMALHRFAAEFDHIGD